MALMVQRRNLVTLTLMVSCQQPSFVFPYEESLSSSQRNFQASQYLAMTGEHWPESLSLHNFPARLHLACGVYERAELTKHAKSADEGARKLPRKRVGGMKAKKPTEFVQQSLGLEDSHRGVSYRLALDPEAEVWELWEASSPEHAEQSDAQDPALGAVVAHVADGLPPWIEHAVWAFGRRSEGLAPKVGTARAPADSGSVDDGLGADKHPAEKHPRVSAVSVRVSDRWRRRGARFSSVVYRKHRARQGQQQRVIEQKELTGGEEKGGVSSSKATARICVCFFGLNRSLEWTFASIQKHIFGALEDWATTEVDESVSRGAEEEAHSANGRAREVGTVNRKAFDVFFHDYSLGATTNKRAREVNVSLGTPQEEAVLFLGTGRLARYVISDQLAFDEAIETGPLSSIRPNFASETHKNVLRQLHSLSQVTRLWEQESTQEAAAAAGGGRNVATPQKEYYDAVLYLRPDLRYFDSLDVGQILGLTASEFLTPRAYAGGLNDRASGGAPAVMRRFGYRVAKLPAFGSSAWEARPKSGRTKDANSTVADPRRPLHPEVFLRWCMADAHAHGEEGSVLSMTPEKGYYTPPLVGAAGAEANKAHATYANLLPGSRPALPALSRVLFSEPFRTARVRATGRVQPFDCGLVFRKSECSAEEEAPPFVPFNRTAARIAAKSSNEKERVFVKPKHAALFLALAG